MKVLFLDFDGVMNNPGCYAVRSGHRAPALPSAVEALNHITNETGAQIVVSASCRIIIPLAELRGMLTDWGASGTVIDSTPTRLHFDGPVPTSRPRGEEIAQWLDRGWREAIESYVVLDDESNLGRVQDRLVQVRGHIGLTMEDAARAIAMLCEAPLTPRPA